MSRKALGNRHPLRRNVTGRLDLGVGDISYLRNHLAELGGCPLHHIVGVRLIEFEQLTRWECQLHVRHVFRHRQLVDHVGPSKGVHTQDGDVLDPVGVLPLDPKGVIDLLAVSPGFHQPCCDAGASTHAGAGPDDALFGVSIQKTICHTWIKVMPPLDQVTSADAFQFSILKSAQATGGHECPHPLEKGIECCFVIERHICRLVPDMQMPDHVADRPTFELGGFQQAFFRQVLDQRIESIAFGAKVVGLIKHLQSPYRSAFRRPKLHQLSSSISISTNSSSAGT